MADWMRAGCWVLVPIMLLGTLAGAQSCTSEAEPTREQVAGVTVSTKGLRVPEKAWRLFYQAVEAGQAGRRKDADRALAAALTIAPEFSESYVLRASMEVVAGQFAAAIEDASAAQRIEPGATWAAVILAGAYNGLRQYREAAVVLANLLPSQAGTWQMKYEMARAAVGMGDAGEALRWSALAAQAAPASCIDTRLLRADALMLARRWSDAAVQLTAYIASEQPQFHRDAVLKALERVRRLAAAQETEKVASANPQER